MSGEDDPSRNNANANKPDDIHLKLRNSSEAPALRQMAEASYGEGNHERAVAYARLAAKLDPNGFATQRTLSGILGVTGHLEEAARVGAVAVSIDPSNSEGRLHLGGLLMATGHFREAARHLAVHTALPGASSQAWRNLSSALQNIGQIDKALETIDKAITLDPNTIEFRLHRASLLTQRGRYSDALEELSTAESQAPADCRVHRTTSGMHELCGNLSMALVSAERAVSLDPTNQEYTAHRDSVARLLGIATKSDLVAVELAERDADSWVKPRHGRAPFKTYDRSSFGNQLSSRWQVIYALMLRDMRTHFTKSRLGYFWAIFEPITHLLTLGSMFSVLNHNPPPVGSSLFLYYCTGLLPYLMFSHVANQVMHSVPNRAVVMNLPSVRTTDIITSTGLIQLSTEIISGVLVFGGFAALGEQGVPSDWLESLSAIGLIWLLGVGVGSINLVINEVIPAWETLFASTIRLMYFASGIYYSPMSMPDTVRDILVWNPMLQGIEWFRAGFYNQYDPHWLDRSYLIYWAASTIIIGLSLERVYRNGTRRHA